MGVQFSPYLVGFALGAAISFVFMLLAFRQRHQRTAIPTVGMLAACTIWATADAVRIATTDETLSLLAHNVRFIGSTLVVFAVVTFVLEYTGRDRWLQPRWLLALGAPFAFMILLVWTESTGLHSLVRADVTFVERGGLTVAEFEWGVWFWVNAAYSYVLLMGGFALFILEFFRQQESTYRRQVAALTVALIVPWFFNGLHVAGITALDLTALGLVVTGVMFYASLFWFQLLDLVPIARSTVVESIEHGFLVLDDDDRVVDVNEHALSVLGRGRAETIGETAAACFSAHPDLQDRLETDREFTLHITRPLEGDARHYEVELTDVQTSGGREIGRVMLLRDVTEQRRQQRQLEERTDRLERQNEQLDQFASIVSHDLRNPINVARGYLDLAREGGDPEHFAEVDESLERMEEIIEDVLQLARNGQQVSEVEPLELSGVATEAWRRVDTADATLELDADLVVEADRGRVQQLLENLFRNALDHGPDDVTVTVGKHDDGFSVADDGPGIPPDKRDEIFDQGYTTASEGTGLGLSIVTAIAEAHGWSVSVSESDAGGAQFDIEGVRTETATDHSPEAA